MKSVLVVDDEEGLRTAIAYDFERQNYKVKTAENGRIARAMMEAEEFDIVISDVRMPGGNGIELLKWIKTAQPTTPCVIFITAFADLQAEDAYDMGAEAIFPKPFDRKALRATVERALIDRSERWIPVPDLAPPGKMQVLGEATQPLRIGNIGRGGFFAQMTAGIPRVDSKITFDASLSDVLRLRGEGIVRWTRLVGVDDRPAGCGIELVNVTDECRKDLVAYMEKVTSTAFIPRK